MEENKSVKDVIEEVCSEVCDKLCKYAETSDDNCECDYIRKYGQCPLDRLC